MDPIVLKNLAVLKAMEEAKKDELEVSQEEIKQIEEEKERHHQQLNMNN